ncbi:MAG: peptidase T [Thermoguttaceae bacterium]|nr:peptidase T [Thermoguttaceae bacterium]
MKTPLERFLKYITIETTSSEETATIPSAPTQFDLARVLVDELNELGLADAQVDEHCYVTATLPTNVKDRNVPTIGLIAHLDTSCAASGANVRAKVVEYQGGKLVLENGTVVPETNEMKALVGKRLVVTDGTTLLGADDKAGIAAIMAAVERLSNSEAPRANVRVCFTPDEEIGNGTVLFNLSKFGADYAYTVDGGPAGEINCETFTADKAIVEVKGVEVHPGEAKDVMINAARILSLVVANLPLERTPERTEGREPFVHLYKLEGGVSSARAEFLLRAFDEEAREENKRVLREAIEKTKATVAKSGECDVDFDEQYLNMGYFLKDCPEALNKLEQATRNVGLEPRWIPIRGGTDGSRLTEMGLPTPNMFTGGRNFHSTMEYLVVEEHEQATQTLVELVRLWAE